MSNVENGHNGHCCLGQTWYHHFFEIPLVVETDKCQVDIEECKKLFGWDDLEVGDWARYDGAIRPPNAVKITFFCGKGDERRAIADVAEVFLDSGASAYQIEVNESIARLEIPHNYYEIAMGFASGDSFGDSNDKCGGKLREALVRAEVEPQYLDPLCLLVHFRKMGWRK